jgi:hypothetical protein
MKRPMLTLADFARYAVALIEMAGGAVGLGILTWAMTGTATFGFVWLLFATFYGLSFVAGLALWRKRPYGVPLSLAIQAIQLPLVIAEKVTFLVASGLGLWLKLGTTGIGWDHVLGSRFQFAWTTGFGHSTGQPTIFGVNLVAAVALLVLVATSRRASGS